MFDIFFFFNDTATTEIYTTDTLFPYTTLFRSRIGRQFVQFDFDVREAGAEVFQRGRQDAVVGDRHEADRQHAGIAAVGLQRSEERRVGKECVSTCRSRWSPYH